MLLLLIIGVPCDPATKAVGSLHFAACLRSRPGPRGCTSSSCGVARPDLLDEFSVSPDPHRWMRCSSKVALGVSNILRGMLGE